MSCDISDFEIGATSPSDDSRIDAIAAHYREILRLIGEDTEREGLLKTPQRAARALWFATQGYRMQPHDILRQAIFEYAGSQMVVVRDIEFYSFCEHHILPFFGKVSIGYIPDGKIVGLSKLPRLVNAIARKLQVQERLTAEICRIVGDVLSPKGVMATCSARHLCVQMRGVEKQLALTETVDYTGQFASDAMLRQEFFRLVGK